MWLQSFLKKGFTEADLNEEDSNEVDSRDNLLESELKQSLPTSSVATNSLATSSVATSSVATSSCIPLPVRVLIVDDSSFCRKVISQMLKRALEDSNLKLDYRENEDGIDAINEVKSNNTGFDAIFIATSYVNVKRAVVSFVRCLYGDSCLVVSSA